MQEAWLIHRLLLLQLSGPASGTNHPGGSRGSRQRPGAQARAWPGIRACPPDQPDWPSPGLSPGGPQPPLVLAAEARGGLDGGGAGRAFLAGEGPRGSVPGRRRRRLVPGGRGRGWGSRASRNGGTGLRSKAGDGVGEGLAPPARRPRHSHLPCEEAKGPPVAGRPEDGPLVLGRGEQEVAAGAGGLQATRIAFLSGSKSLFTFSLSTRDFRIVRGAVFSRSSLLLPPAQPTSASPPRLFCAPRPRVYHRALPCLDDRARTSPRFPF